MTLPKLGKHSIFLLPYLLGGFGCLLSYILALRTAGIQYVYHYVPAILNPVLLSPFLDSAVWAASTIALSIIALVVYWRQNRCHRSLVVFALTCAATLIAASATLVPTVTPWAIMLTGIPLIYIIYKPLDGLDRRTCLQASMYAVIGAWLIVEAATATFLLFHRESVHIFPIDLERQVASLSINLMYAFQPYSVQLLLLTSFSWIAAPLMTLTHKRKEFSVRSRHSRLGYAVLVVSVTLSIVAIAIPYIRNPGLYGVDTRYYLDQLTSMNDVEALLKLLSADPRTLYVLLLKFFTILGGSSELAINIGSVVLAALNAYAFYLFSGEIVKDRFAGGLAAVFSALGMQTSVSLYAGIYSNWLSMFLAALAFGFYLRAVRTKNSALFFVAGLCVAIGLVAHPWSGLVYASTLLSSCVVDVVSFWWRHKRLQIAESMLALAIVLILFVGYLFLGLAGSIQDLRLFPQITSLEKLTSSLAFSMSYMVGGFMSAPIFYITALLGFSCLCLNKGASGGTRLVSLWLVTTSIALLFAEQWLQWRLIYSMPIQTLSGLGAYYASHFLFNIEEDARPALLVIFICALVLAMFNYLLRNVSFIPSI